MVWDLYILFSWEQWSAQMYKYNGWAFQSTVLNQTIYFNEP